MRWIRRIAATFLIVLVVWGLVVWSGVLPRPTEAQRASLAALESVSPASGERNAFAFLQFGDFDVDESEMDALAAADVAAYEQWARSQPDKMYESEVKAKLQRVSGGPIREEPLCRPNHADCLARVARDTEAIRAELVQFDRATRNARHVAQFDHYRDGYAAWLTTPIPSVNGMTVLVPNAVALRFHDGDRAGAMADLCDYATGWRRLMSNSDSLIVSMVGVSAIGIAAQLHGELLAALPPDESPPAACTAAFARLSELEMDQCRVWAYEFRNVSAGIDFTLSGPGDDSRPWIDRLSAPFVNRAHTRALLAQPYARYCSDEHRARVRARGDTALRPQGPACRWHDEVFNPIGCLIASVAVPDLDQYWNRVLDLDDRLRLVGVALWVRSQSDDPETALRRLPDELRFPRLNATSAANGWIEVDLRIRRSPTDSRIPIAGGGTLAKASH